MNFVYRIKVCGESTSSQVTNDLCSTNVYTCIRMLKRMQVNEYIVSKWTTKYVTRSAEIIYMYSTKRLMK